VLSNQEVYRRLASRFIGLRLDWEQGNHFKERFGFVLGTGDQLLLRPDGTPIAHEQGEKTGRASIIYGRHGCDTTAEVLDTVAAKFPLKSSELKLEWFLWPRKPARRSGGSYPVAYESIAGYARLPLAFVDGPLLPALTNQSFLERHLRQFIWVRGGSDGESRIRIARVKDGLKLGLPLELATISGVRDRKAIDDALDVAWLEYMKTRPFTARGYLENPHGKWMRRLADQMVWEDEEIRRRAVAGTLIPPGRISQTR
jgi:hypothetical protein